MTEVQFSSAPRETVRLLPIYLVCDTSQSMEKSGAIGEVNAGLADILEAIVKQGAKGDDIRIAVLSFSTHARLELGLTSVGLGTAAPTLTGGGVTNLAEAVKLLAATLATDYQELRRRNERAYRPAVFFFTDGRPTDEQGHELVDHSSWSGPLDELKEHPVWGPRIYAYGFGEARPDLLQTLVLERSVSDSAVAGRAHFTGKDAAASIARIFPHLFKTIVSAMEVASSGAGEESIRVALDQASTSFGAIDPDDWWGSKN